MLTEHQKDQIRKIEIQLSDCVAVLEQIALSDEGDLPLWEDLNEIAHDLRDHAFRLGELI